MVRIAQGLVHMGKGTMSLNPYHRYEIKYLYRLSVRLAPSLAGTRHYIVEQKGCCSAVHHSYSSMQCCNPARDGAKYALSLLGFQIRLKHKPLGNLYVTPGKINSNIVHFYCMLVDCLTLDGFPSQRLTNWANFSSTIVSSRPDT